MSKPSSGILGCLSAAERAHRQARTGGRRGDPDWADWYARYLLAQTGLNRQTARRWQIDELTEALLNLDAAYSNGSQNQPWAVYLAARLSL